MVHTRTHAAIDLRKTSAYIRLADGGIYLLINRCRVGSAFIYLLFLFGACYNTAVALFIVFGAQMAEEGSTNATIKKRRPSFLVTIRGESDAARIKREAKEQVRCYAEASAHDNSFQR